MRVHSFAPIASVESRVLILGTMPGRASLRARQYYAHPQNAFWPIVGELLGFDAAGDYLIRTSSLTAAGIALWDVLQSCERESSLDSDIDRATVVANDFVTFFARYPRIRRIYFNGAHAERLYARYARPLLADLRQIETVRLPSTSPAYAAMPLAEKLRAWRAVVA